MSSFNDAIVAEFRSNEGQVGGRFAGAPMILVHHSGRTSGTEYVNPVVYLPDADDPDTVYVFGSNGGRADHPNWYRNLIAYPTTIVEVGAETYEVTVTELHGAERDRIYAQQAARMPGFADYEQKTAGIRTIPVVALTRVRGS